MAKRSDPFTVIVEQDEEGWFVANVPELRGCHTQAKSLDVLMKRIAEAITLSLAESPRRTRRTFVGVQQEKAACQTIDVLSTSQHWVHALKEARPILLSQTVCVAAPTHCHANV